MGGDQETFTVIKNMGKNQKCIL